MTDTPPHRPPGPPDAAPTADDPRGLDERALAQLRALDPDGRHGVLPRVLGAFETSLQRLQAQLADVWERRDAKAIGDIAHTLKSSSASVGALTLARLCVEAERAVRGGDTEGLGALVAALRAESSRVLTSVRAMLRH
jgi:histidine phosphotransfer protein HptB